MTATSHEPEGAKPLRVLTVTARYLPETGGVEEHVRQVTGWRQAVPAWQLLPRTLQVGSLPTSGATGWRCVASERGLAEVTSGWLPRCTELSPAATGHRPRPVVPHLRGPARHARRGTCGNPLCPNVPCRRSLLPDSPSCTPAAANALAAVARSCGAPRGAHAGQGRRLCAGAPSRPTAIRDRPEWRGDAAGRQRAGARREMGAASDRRNGSLIISIGRLERYKGHHRILRAMPQILARRPDARLWITGSGAFEADLQRLAAALGISDRVKKFPRSRAVTVLR